MASNPITKTGVLVVRATLIIMVMMIDFEASSFFVGFRGENRQGSHMIEAYRRGFHDVAILLCDPAKFHAPEDPTSHGTLKRNIGNNEHCMKRRIFWGKTQCEHHDVHANGGTEGKSWA